MANTELYPNIITRVEINNTVCPYSSEEGIFNASLNETLLLDIRDKVGDEIYTDLITNGVESGATFSDDTQLLMDNGLKLAIGYYVVARTLRKPSTPTRFGVTNKLNSEMTSEPASNSQIVSQANYYKSVADSLIEKLLNDFPITKANNNVGFNIRVVGE